MFPIGRLACVLATPLSELSQSKWTYGTYCDVIEYIIGFIILFIRVNALKAVAIRSLSWVRGIQGMYNIMMERGVQQIKKITTKDTNMMTTCDKGNYAKQI